MIFRIEAIFFTPLFKLVRAIGTDRRGATAVEYALIIACIMLVIFATLSQVGVNVAGVLSHLGDQLKSATN